MHKYTIFFSLVFISTLGIPLVAEEENADKIILAAKKITIQSGMAWGGFGIGLIGGSFAGGRMIQDNDSSAVMGAKIGISAILGAACGTIAGKNIGHKYVEYYYPEKFMQKSNSETLLSKR